MKISILADSALYISPHVTGSMVQQYNLAVSLAKAGEDVYVHFTGETFDKELVNNKYHGITLVSCPVKRKKLNWWHKSKVYISSLDKVQPDVIYTRGRSILLYVASKWAGMNKMLHVWATNGEDSWEYWK